jgi:uncharacterized protein YndB with AHSA1/START domain
MLQPYDASHWQAVERTMSAGDRLDVATFDNRYTMRFGRYFPVPIERVWHAVTSEELNIWLYPVTRVDLKLGGRASFTWGQPEHAPQICKITKLKPPELIRFATTDKAGRVDHKGYLQFELEPSGGGTRFTFIDKVSPVPEAERVASDQEFPKDAAFPGGADAPWRPGFVAGFHLNMDALGICVAMVWTPERIQDEVERRISSVNGEVDGEGYWLADELAYAHGSPRWTQLVDVYYDYIRRFLPSRNGRAPEDLSTYPGLAADLASRHNSVSA